MLDADNVRVAVTGVVSMGAVGATAPTDADGPLTAPSDEVQTVTITGTPTGGTFTLTYKGQTTSALAFNAAAAAVQAALVALSTIGAGNVTVAGSAGGPYTVTFTGDLADADAAALTASGAGLTGGSTPAVAVTTATPGGVGGFADLGYVSEDGITETRDRSSNKIRAWQNGATVREVITEADLTYQLTLLETKTETVELYYGSNVDPATGRIVIVPSKTGGRHAFVIDVIDGDDFLRIHIPSGEVTEVGDQVYANGEPIGYEVTITAYPHESIVDEDGNQGSAEKFYSSLAA